MATSSCQVALRFSHDGSWSDGDMVAQLREIRFAYSPLGAGRVETFFDPQKLQVTGRDGPRRDRLSLFLLYRV